MCIECSFFFATQILTGLLTPDDGLFLLFQFCLLLLQHFLCLLYLLTGDASIFGKSVRFDISDIRRQISIVPQFDLLWAEMRWKEVVGCSRILCPCTQRYSVCSAPSAVEHLRMFGRLKGLSGSRLEADVVRCLDQVGLHEVAIASAIIACRMCDVDPSNAFSFRFSLGREQ